MLTVITAFSIITCTITAVIIGAHRRIEDKTDVRLPQIRMAAGLLAPNNSGNARTSAPEGIALKRFGVV
jgi:hypothetical protein